ncbi:MAG: RnfABCDGE type electron transport complex subunit D [Bacteroides sp.]|jgi:electron transport complex protein RnfD|nr:RnfABCDGE type electron transport complex subunit D [Bacteroides sp.]
MANKFIVSLSPHVHSGDSVQKNMYGVLIALIPALLVSLFAFGLGAAIVTITSVAACVFFEWAISKFIMKQDKCTICDGSAVITGVLLAFNLPSNLPIWIIIIGALVAIGIGKMTFGGLGCNPFNPALVGRVFLLISFPVQMTSWPQAGQLTSYLDAQTGATPLAIMKQAIKAGDASILNELPSSLNMLIGIPDTCQMGAGCLGEISAAALILGLLFMLWKKIITWHVPVSILGTVFVFAGLMHLANPIYASPLAVLLSGGMMLGAIFMATDYVTSPMTHKGMIIYGVAIGFLTVVIRNFGAYPEGMSFAILIMNAFTPLINTYCKPKRFGEVVKK